MKNLILIIMTILISTTLYARPKAVILIRHAEEPIDEDSNGLSKIGHQRAQELFRLFIENPTLKEAGIPVALFAAGAKKKSSSIRSIQTLIPLGKTLKLNVDDSFDRDDYKALSQEILSNIDYNDKVVMICWQHKKMPLIAKLIGVENPPSSPSEKFDRLWLVTYDSKGKGSLLDLPQNLLPGDDTK